MLACPWNLGARALVNNYFWGARVTGGTVLACGLPSNGLPLLLRTPIYVMRIMISGVPHSTEGYNYRVYNSVSEEMRFCSCNTAKLFRTVKGRKGELGLWQL
jgi:hypothetical protein